MKLLELQSLNLSASDLKCIHISKTMIKIIKQPKELKGLLFKKTSCIITYGAARKSCSIRADLHDTILSHATSSRQAYDMTYDCRSVLKHVLKCYDIFSDVHNN